MWSRGDFSQSAFVPRPAERDHFADVDFWDAIVKILNVADYIAIRGFGKALCNPAADSQREEKITWHGGLDTPAVPATFIIPALRPPCGPITLAAGGKCSEA